MENGLNKGIEISFKDYESNKQILQDSQIPTVAGVKITVKNTQGNGEDVIKFGMYERNRGFYLQNPDIWAEKIIKNWSLSEDQIMPYLSNNSGIPNADTEEICNNIIKDLNELLASYAPVIKSEEYYKKIIQI